MSGDNPNFCPRCDKHLPAVADLRAENKKLLDAIKDCLQDFRVGDGKVVCPEALLPHLRRFFELLRESRS